MKEGGSAPAQDIAKDCVWMVWELFPVGNTLGLQQHLGC